MAGLVCQRQFSTQSADSCKSLVNNFTNCICLGCPDRTPDPHGGARLWACFSKTRNSAEAVDRIVRHNKYFARLDDVTSMYREDRVRHRFIARDE